MRCPRRYTRSAGGWAAIVLILGPSGGCARPAADLSDDPAPAGSVGPQAVSLQGRPLYTRPPGDTTKLEADLAAARAAYEADPDDPDALIWVGRRLGYLWRMQEAIAVYTEGLERFHDYAPLYRHRGHRYISVREFARAERDLEKAAELMAGEPDVVEQDGMPNAQNIPLTTLKFNIWYHLGLARYLQRDYEGALAAYRETMNHTRGFDDNVVAVTYWLYLTLRALDRDAEAQAALLAVLPEMSIIENTAYHRLLLLFRGAIGPEELLDEENASQLDLATMGYGLARWRLCQGSPEEENRGIEVLERAVEGPYWPAFGHIAAEVLLAERNAQGGGA